MQPVEDLEDALAEGGAAHYRVVDDDEVVLVGPERAVADVIDVGCQVVAFAAVADEGAQLDVLPHHFFNTHVVVESAYTVGHTVEGHLGGVGDI